MTITDTVSSGAKIFVDCGSPIFSLDISPNKRFVAVGLNHGTCQIYNLVSGELVHTFIHTLNGNDKDIVWSVAFSPYNDQLISGSNNGTIKLWNLANGTATIFPGNTGSVLSVAFSPNGDKIATGSADHTIRIWDLEGNNTQAFTEHQDKVASVAFSPDGQFLASGSYDTTIKLWDLNKNTLDRNFKAHVAAVFCVAFSPDGKRLVSGSFDTTLKVHQIVFDRIPFDPFMVRRPEAAQLNSHEARILSVTFSPDSKTIISGGEDETVRSWKTDRWDHLSADQILSGHKKAVMAVKCVPDNDLLTIVSGSLDGTIRLWNEQGKPLANLSNRKKQITAPQPIENDRDYGVDQLNIKHEIDALASVLMSRHLAPPVAVGILGGWGSGKSFGMNLIQEKIREIRCQSLTDLEAWGGREGHSSKLASQFVGHIYQIKFNAWTYSKANLWASLMQEIFYELNRQISLEHRLTKEIVTPQSAPSEQFYDEPSTKEQDKEEAIVDDYDVLNEASRIKEIVAAFPERMNDFWFSLQYRSNGFLRKNLPWIKNLDLAIAQPLLHITILVLGVPFLIVFGIPWALFVALIARIDDLTFNWLSENDIGEASFVLKWLSGQLFDYHFLIPGVSHLSTSDNFRLKLNSLVNNLHAGENEVNLNLSATDHLLNFVHFFLIGGFLKRLRLRRKYWDKTAKNLDDAIAQYAERLNLKEGRVGNLTKASDAATAYFYSPQEVKTLLAGGEVWGALYTSIEQMDAALPWNRTLQGDGKPVDAGPSVNFLWETLKQIKETDQQRLRDAEENLQDKEKELQRRLKSAEMEVNQRISRSLGATFWKPLVNGFARLRFSSDEIEGFAASEQTFRMLCKTINSWQGLLALFCMAVFIVLTSHPEAVLFWWQGLSDRFPWLYSLLNFIPAQVLNFLRWARQNWPTWLQVFSATAVALLPTLQAVGAYSTSLQKEQARIKSERPTLLKEAQASTTELANEVAVLQLQVEEQRQRLGLTANSASLIDFVNSRLDTESYSQYFGLMQVVRQDLLSLSERLTVGPHNQEQLEKIFPRGPARVVLYIDDLDRCPPDRVVEVLEAVQLLLKTKLFIVVLAIDDRYIARALEQVYQGVLKRKGKPSGIDYLEKIIQIPYRMRPISPHEVNRYLASQVMIKQSLTSEPQSVAAQPADLADIAASTQVQPADANNTEKQPQLAAPERQAVSSERAAEKASENVPDTPPEPTLPSQNQQDDTDEPLPPLEIETALTELDVEEFKILVDCCKQVDITPRTAKRLINIYKILHIIWTARPHSTSPYIANPDTKKVVMSFLALSGRYPEFMRHLFEEMDDQLERASYAEPHRDLGAAHTFKLNTLLGQIAPPKTDTDTYRQREWRRFRFDIHRLLSQDNQNAAVSEQTSLTFELTRQTFELMLSFCFVGDIGYDPDDYQATPGPEEASEIEVTDPLKNRHPAG
jgi:WD40 repeat protein